MVGFYLTPNLVRATVLAAKSEAYTTAPRHPQKLYYSIFRNTIEKIPCFDTLSQENSFGNSKSSFRFVRKGKSLTVVACRLNNSKTNTKTTDLAKSSKRRTYKAFLFSRDISAYFFRLSISFSLTNFFNSVSYEKVSGYAKHKLSTNFLSKEVQ